MTLAAAWLAAVLGWGAGGVPVAVQAPPDEPPVEEAPKGPVGGARAPGIRPSTMRILSMTAEADPQGMDGKTLSLLRRDEGILDDLVKWTTLSGDPCPWRVDGKRGLLAGAEPIRSVREFGDLQLHLEFLLPETVNAFGQGKANSGLLLLGAYELQILDSFGQPPRIDGCGAFYRVAAPEVNAVEPPGLWQTFDVVVRAPRFDAEGAVLEYPRATVLLNGRVIHNNLELTRRTPASATADEADPAPPPARGPIVLQGNTQGVRFRNIWVRVP